MCHDMKNVGKHQHSEVPGTQNSGNVNPLYVLMECEALLGFLIYQGCRGSTMIWALPDLLGAAFLKITKSITTASICSSHRRPTIVCPNIQNKSQGLWSELNESEKKCPSILPPELHLDSDHLFSYFSSSFFSLCVSYVITHKDIEKEHFPSMCVSFQVTLHAWPLSASVHSTLRKADLTDKFGKRKKHVRPNSFVLPSSWELTSYRNHVFLTQHTEHSLEITLFPGICCDPGQPVIRWEILEQGLHALYQPYSPILAFSVGHTGSQGKGGPSRQLHHMGCREFTWTSN